MEQIFDTPTVHRCHCSDPYLTVRTLLLTSVVLALVNLTGCEALPTRVTERFATVEPQEREIEKNKGVVFQAVGVAFKKMNFTISRSLEAQGIVVARSSIRSDDAFREARQYEFDIKLREFGEGATKISVRLQEQVEGDLKAGATSQVLRSHGLYDAFFEALDQALAEVTASPAPAAN